MANTENTLTFDDLLLIMTEECGEVIQAIVKCQRFGMNRFYPGYGINREVLAKEIGDLLGIVDAIVSGHYAGDFDQRLIDMMKESRRTKFARALAAKNESRPVRVWCIGIDRTE